MISKLSKFQMCKPVDTQERGWAVNIIGGQTYHKPGAWRALQGPSYHINGIIVSNDQLAQIVGAH